MLELLAAGWGIKKASIHPMPSLYGKAWLVYAEQGKKYVLKEQFGHLLKAEHAVLFCLDAQKMPVAVPVATAGGRYHATFGKRFYCLYPFLPGDVVSDYFTAGAEKRAYLFGKAIGKLHLALRNCRHPAFPVVEWGAMAPDLADLPEQFKSAQLDCQHLEGAIARFAAEYAPLAESLPRHLTHGDLHPGNMLFQGETVTGYFDFEIVAHRPRIYDPVYCAAAMFLFAFPDPGKSELWLDLLPALLKGYSSAGKLTENERRAVFPVMLASFLSMISVHCQNGAFTYAAFIENVLAWIHENEARIKQKAAGFK